MPVTTTGPEIIETIDIGTTMLAFCFNQYQNDFVIYSLYWLVAINTMSYLYSYNTSRIYFPFSKKPQNE